MSLLSAVAAPTATRQLESFPDCCFVVPRETIGINEDNCGGRLRKERQGNRTSVGPQCRYLVSASKVGTRFSCVVLLCGQKKVPASYWWRRAGEEAIVAVITHVVEVPARPEG